jgi:hypothetical protein
VNPPQPVVHVEPSSAGVAVPVRLGVPLPRGWCVDPVRVGARGTVDDAAVPMQGRALAHWSDGSVKWLLVDALPPAAGGALRLDPGIEPGQAGAGARLGVDSDATRVAVATGAATLDFGSGDDRLLNAVTLADGTAQLGARGVRLRATDAAGQARGVRVETVQVEEAGPVRAVVVARGTIEGDGPLAFVARWWIAAGARSALLELRVRNSRAALHPGGLWDLGDPGSVLLGDLSVEIEPAAAPTSITWRATPQDTLVDAAPADWALYQDSSGGERWDSPNHVEADGRLGVSFRGWTTRGADAPAQGLRAQPALALHGPAGRIALSLQDFWQNFPKALRSRDGCGSVGLFPAERGRPTELQGGEQKRHRLALAFGEQALEIAEALVSPPHAWIAPAWVEASGAVSGLVVDLEGDAGWTRHVRTIVDGPNAFAERREVIDEYGWRHFGDLWADHEAVLHTGPEPFVTHYNNQYDFVWGAGLHALRTGDARWARLARECADHTTDIDVYHTDADRAAFNHGLFWHTDHYRPAHSCTHRTYSAANAAGGDYGGGPSNEHDYASGLLLHHLRTGDADAHEAVIGLADWVIAMDDGARTLLGLVDPGPTGLASRTLDPDYHGPGRGAGNSIATLLDAYAVSTRRGYLEQAEALVRRCIHPADDIATRRLDDPERRWSYLVFLQVLGGRFLAAKDELGERDWMFQYARAALLHYADWMLEHETPYQDVAHKLELPTETWPAHDLRKVHVMHLAARWDDRGRAEAYRARAASWRERALGDLDAFETRHLTRPLVILASYAHLQRYFERLVLPSEAERAAWRHAYDFGVPQPFLTQRARLGATLRARLATVRAEVLRLVRDRLARRAARRRRA